MSPAVTLNPATGEQLAEYPALSDFDADLVGPGRAGRHGAGLRAVQDPGATT